ncbi:hypothetical protein [Sphingopyxis terrae]|uniref:hypothetical protein n=1 Tax=Sphingopyxis terrae TaxID=33052 RepID=UPI003F82120F
MTTISDDAFVRLFQERGGLAVVDGWAGKDTLALLDQLLPPRPGTDRNAAVGEIPESYWPLLAQIESGNRPYVKASTSSASGLYQFIKSTWEGEGGRWGSDMSKAFGGLQPSAEEQLQRAKSFTGKNAAYLRQRGIPINCASLYAAHFLGVLTAASLIGADVGASAEALAGPAATRANPSILKGKTVGQFLKWLHAKTGEWAR